jgi:hypothetical protein
MLFFISPRGELAYERYVALREIARESRFLLPNPSLS